MKTASAKATKVEYESGAHSACHILHSNLKTLKTPFP
jgi:hypothetical protein